MPRKSLAEQNESVHPKKLKHEFGSTQTELSVLNSKLITSCDVLLVECDKENESQLIDYLKNFSSLEIQKKEEIMEIIFRKLTRFVDKPVLKDKFCLEEECVYNLEDVNQHKLLAFISFFEKILVENCDQFLGEKRIKILFALLKCLDQKIRESVNSFLRNLFKIKEKELKEIYKNILRNEYISILNHQNEPVGLECLLELSLYVLVSNGFETFCELETFFKECIFPILKIQNSTLYFNEFKSLLRAFSVSDSSALPLILAKLVNLFYCENTEKKSMAVNLASNIIKTKEIHLRFSEIEFFLVKMINLCFKSDHIFLINAVYKLLSDDSIFYLLKQNKSFLPKIFDSFYDLSYKHWNVKKSPEIPHILDLLMNIDPMGYFECAKLYKYNKYKECMEKQCLYDDDNDFDKKIFNEQIVGIRKKSKPFKK